MTLVDTNASAPLGGRYLVTRSEIAQKSSYLEYKEELRLDFWFSCAYCSMSEAEALGFRFTIDHYEPQVSHKSLSNQYDNLMYCCDQCNIRKSDLIISESARAAGYRFYRPDRDFFSDHFSLRGIRIESKSLVGEWTENQLDLNRAALLKIRELRLRLMECHELVSEGVRGLKGVKLDQLPQNVKGRAARAIRDTLGIASSLEDDVDAILQSYARSPLLDVDEDASSRAVERKEYLADLKTLYPGTWRGREMKRK